VWPRGWLELQLYSSMTAALEVGEWSAARPGRTLPPGKTRYPLYRRLGGPQGRSGRAEILVSTGIRSRTVQPVVSRYTDWATRRTHPPTHTNTHTHIYIYFIYLFICGPGSSDGLATNYGLDGPGSNTGGDDFPPVQTGPGTHPTFCKRVPGLSRG